jgi:hypothetical protein
MKTGNRHVAIGNSKKTNLFGLMLFALCFSAQAL